MLVMAMVCVVVLPLMPVSHRRTKSLTKEVAREVWCWPFAAACS